MLASTLTLALAATTALAGPLAARQESTVAPNQATYYAVGLGACGGTNNDNEAVVALNQVQWDGGAHCGKTVKLTDPKTSKTVNATIVDLCPSCLEGSLDLSPTLFEQLYGSKDGGRVPLQFEFVN